jgi:hypothetical protein
MTPAAAMAFIGAFISGQVLRVDGGGQCWAGSGGCWFAGRNPSGLSSFLDRTGLDDRIVGGASQASAASAFLPEGSRLLQTAFVALRFADVLRTHERDFDIRLHDVSRSGNAFVWRSGCRELVLSQDAGLPAWRSHDRNMALPDMVVDKPVLD